MRFFSFFKKEAYWTKRNIMAVMLIFLIFPAGLMYGTTVFGDVLPTDTPVAVSPASDDVTEDDIAIARGSVTIFSDPRTYEDTETAKTALQREEVYAVVEVPPRITEDSDTTKTFTVYVDGSIVPFKEPSELMVNLLNIYLQNNLDQSISVERDVIGNDNILSEYLVPVGLLFTIMMFSFAYLPYHMMKEKVVLNRIRVTSSIEQLVATKITVFSLLLLLPLLVLYGLSTWFGYIITPITIPIIGMTLLTTVYLCAISLSVMFFTNFSVTGQFINISLLIGHIALAGMIYPAGFFSDIHREIVRMIPLHYSAIIIRSEMLKDVPITVFTDWIFYLLLFTIGTLIALEISIKYYEVKE